jgi:hypothetical protein
MSQVSWPQPGENDNYRSPSRDNRERSRYEGFEGMNFEQRREPYNPQPASNSHKNKASGEEGRDPNDA